MNILKLKKFEFIYIWSKLVTESMAYKIDSDLCYFILELHI